MATPLLRTKLYIPPARPDAQRVSRPRLIERLEEGLRLGCKLTLISAPAGFGKTTLLSEWIRMARADCRLRPVVGAHRDAPLQVAWISLDDGDNDPIRFWSYVVAALQTVQADIGATALAALQGPQPQPLPIEALLTSLINEIASAGPIPLSLVLDDWHVITASQVNKGITFLLDHLPPTMRLVVSTRADPPWPLARLRARGEMIELRTEDLRFTPDEVAAFLNGVMGLALSAEDVTALDARTEGWIAGLQMAALSMQGRGDVMAFVQSFGGSHRFILDYLVEEVLDRQPDDVQGFLLKTSILGRLSAPLCDAILDTEPPNIGQDACEPPPSLEPLLSSQAVLERLEQANLFLIPLDDERRWYRYHHLFAELLRSRLEQTQPDQVPVLRHRASEWCEDKGLVDEAISYALAAGHQERAADLILRYGSEAARRGAYLSLHRWLASLPEDTIRSRPHLCIWYGATSVYHSLEAAERWAETAERALSARTGDVDGYGPSDPIRVELLNLRANIAYLRGDGPQVVLRLVEQARALLPEGQTLPYGLVMRLAEAYKDLGKDEASDGAYVQAQQLAEAGRHYAIALHAVCGRVLIARRYGRLPQAVALCRQALRTIAEPVERSGGRLPVAGLVHILLGRILLEWNDLEEARGTLTRGLALSEPLWGHVFRSMGRAALARTLIAQGHVDDLPELDDLTEQPWSAYTDYVAALRAWIAWMHARRAATGLEAVPEWVQAVQWANDRPLRPAYQDFYIRPQFLQVRLHIAQHREYGQPPLEPVLDYVREQYQLLKERGWTELMIDASIVQAMALQAQDKREQALMALERALTLAQPGRWVRIFVDEGPPMAELIQQAAARGIEPDYANRLLAALDADGKIRQRARAGARSSIIGPSPPLVEPLSDRELEVLRLLPTELSSTEIAEALYISKNTARSHIGHIYGKLGVHSREDAVQRAQTLGLL